MPPPSLCLCTSGSRRFSKQANAEVGRRRSTPPTLIPQLNPDMDILAFKVFSGHTDAFQRLLVTVVTYAITYANRIYICSRGFVPLSSSSVVYLRHFNTPLTLHITCSILTRVVSIQFKTGLFSSMVRGPFVSAVRNLDVAAAGDGKLVVDVREGEGIKGGT